MFFFNRIRRILPPDAPDLQGAGDAPESKQYKVLEVVLEKDEKEVLWLKEVVQGNTTGNMSLTLNWWR